MLDLDGVPRRHITLSLVVIELVVLVGLVFIDLFVLGVSRGVDYRHELRVGREDLL